MVHKGHWMNFVDGDVLIGPQERHPSYKIFSVVYSEPKKTRTFYFYDNFGKCWPILIILSFLRSKINCRRSGNSAYRFALNLLPHYLANCECSTIRSLVAWFYWRTMLCKRGLCRHALFICPSVCLLRSWILSNRINISSTFFSPSGSHTILVFFVPNVMTIFRRGSRNNCDYGQIAGYRSMTAAVCDQQLTVFCAVVYSRYGARLFMAQTATHQWIHRRE